MSARVMIVDDSMMVRHQVRHVLTAAGFTVVEASDGAIALSKLAEETVALVVLDVNMPNMGGLQFLQAVREDPNLAGVPVVMLTTEGAPGLMQEAKVLGAKGWIVKPFKDEMLVTAVKKITRTA